MSGLTAGSPNTKGRISQSAVARGIGRSATAVSQFLKGEYPGDNLTIAQEIDAWMKRHEERTAHKGIFAHTIETFAVKKVRQACRIAHIENEMVVITGDAGVGKTKGINAYKEQNPDVLIIAVIPNYTAKTLMRDIHSQIGFNGEGTVIDMFRDVVERLKGSDRLLIIDEAEHLPYKALECLRRLYDLAGIGLALVGMPQLIGNMRGNRGQYRQLYSRVAVHADIPDMRDHPESVEALIKSELPNGNGIWQDFYNETTNGRRLGKLLKLTVELSKKNNSDITAEMIKEAKKLILI